MDTRQRNTPQERMIRLAAYFPFAKRPLGCGYIGLEPACDPNTLYLHHEKIYGGYVDGLNYLLARYPEYQGWSLAQLLQGDLQMPPVEKARILHDAGGVFNHNLYFSLLCGVRETVPEGRLAEALNTAYGSIGRFHQLFREAAQSILGPGWVWLTAEEDGTPHIVITQNNQVPALDSLSPVFVADTWEHAYFLCYPARLDAYVEGWFQTLDWKKAEQNYQHILYAGALQRKNGRT